MRETPEHTALMGAAGENAAADSWETGIVVLCGNWSCWDKKEVTVVPLSINSERILLGTRIVPGCKGTWIICGDFSLCLKVRVPCSSNILEVVGGESSCSGCSCGCGHSVEPVLAALGEPQGSSASRHCPSLSHTWSQSLGKLVFAVAFSVAPGCMGLFCFSSVEFTPGVSRSPLLKSRNCQYFELGIGTEAVELINFFIQTDLGPYLRAGAILMQ